MRPKLSHVAAAAALAGFLGFGGMSLAYAQDSGTSGTTTESPGCLRALGVALSRRVLSVLSATSQLMLRNLTCARCWLCSTPTTDHQ